MLAVIKQRHCGVDKYIFKFGTVRSSFMDTYVHVLTWIRCVFIHYLKSCMTSPYQPACTRCGESDILIEFSNFCKYKSSSQDRHSCPRFWGHGRKEQCFQMALRPFTWSTGKQTNGESKLHLFLAHERLLQVWYGKQSLTSYWVTLIRV